MLTESAFEKEEKQLVVQIHSYVLVEARTDYTVQQLLVSDYK